MMMKKVLLSLLLVLAGLTAFGQETTMSPSISFNENDDVLEVHIYCPEEAELFVDDESVGIVETEYVYLVSRSFEEQYITVTAFAQADGKLPSPVTASSYVLSPMPMQQTAMPVITVTKPDNGGCYVTITNDQEDPYAEIFYAILLPYGEQTDWMLYDGEPIMFTEEGYYTVMAYAKVEGKTDSEVTYMQFQVDQYKQEMATPPLIHPLQFSQSSGLRMNITTDPLYEEYKNGYNPEPYTFVDTEAFYYSINGGEQVALPRYGGTIALPGYGHYTIEAFGQAAGALDSHTVKAIVDYDASGYTTLCNGIIVHNGIIYDVEDGNTAALSSGDSMIRPGFDLHYSGDIVIPATVSIDGKTYNVTGIKHRAFAERDYGITGIHLPRTISYIEENPLDFCRDIESITVDSSNPFYDSRFNCNAIIETATNTLIAGCNKTTVPHNIEAIGDYAFYNCEGLKLIFLPQSVTTVGKGAFGGCYSLQTIVCRPTTPPSVAETDSEDYPYIFRLYVPSDAEYDYLSHEFWGRFPIQSTNKYTPLVLFDESADELTVHVFTDDDASVTIDGSGMGCLGSLTYSIPRRTSEDFHILVYIIYLESAYYFGYDSRYSTFATLPMMYASEVEQGKGLKINVCADANDYYNLYFWTDGFTHVWPESCHYRINGADEWASVDIDGSFYLPAYGDYTIEAYGAAGGDDCCNSATVTIDVHYGLDGFYSRCYSYIVYNGMYYFPENGYGYEYKKNVTAILSQDAAQGDYLTLPALTHIVIPASLTIAGDQYTVTGVQRHFCDNAGSITCLSSTPIPASLYYSEGDPFFEQVALFVPQDGLEAYKADAEWGRFMHIVPFVGAGPGDVDGDGAININDLTDLIGMLLNGNMPAWADINGDGLTDIDDITYLIDIVLGKR